MKSKNKKNHKLLHNLKSQMQMMETIGVLFIFFMLVAFGFKFYGVVMQKNYEKMLYEQFQLDTIQAAQSVAFMPELKCSEDVVKEREDCIDILKLFGAKAIINDHKTDYYDTFGYAKITIDQIYPESVPDFLGNDPWTIYDNSLPESDIKEKSIVRIPVALLNPKNGHVYLGIIIVEAQRKLT